MVEKDVEGVMEKFVPSYGIKKWWIWVPNQLVTIWFKMIDLTFYHTICILEYQQIVRFVDILKYKLYDKKSKDCGG